MSSPERMELMERNISRLALLVQQLGEFELVNQQRQLEWLQWMQESDQRMRESDQRMRESDQRIQESERRIRESDQRIQESDQRMQAIMAEIHRLNEQSGIQAEKIRAMFEVVVEIQSDVARIDAAS